MDTQLLPPLVRPPPPRNLLDDLLEVDVPDGLALNRAGDRVAYHTHTKWNNHKHGEHCRSSVWVADVGREKSARRLTDGTEYHDHSPQWSPDGRCIFFLSNRRTGGTKYSIYYVDVDLALRGGTVDVKENFFDDFDDPFYLARNHDALDRYNNMRPPDFFRSGDGFQDNPDDRATDTLRELSDATECRDIAKFEMCPQWRSSGLSSTLVFLGQLGHRNDTDFDSDDPSVRFAAGLRNLGKRFAGFSDVAHNNIYYATTHRNLMGTQRVRDGYVVDVAWSSDGQRTVAVTRPSADPDSAELGGFTFWVETSFSDDFAERVFHVPQATTEPGSLVWVGPHVYFLSWNVASDASSGLAVYRLDVDASRARMKVKAAAAAMTLDNACTKVIMGSGECCPRSFKAVRGPRPWPGDGSSDDVLVHMQQGTDEKLVLVRENRENRTLSASEKAILDYAAINVGTDDDNRNNNTKSTVLVVVQGDINNPSEVFSMDPSTGGLVQLSDHGGAFLAKQQQQSFGTPGWIECSIPVRTGNDAVTIDALIYLPVASCPVRPVRRGFGANFRHLIHTDNVVSDAAPAPAPPYPTVILVHDGPYSRATNGFDRRASEPDLAEFLVPLLLRAGVAVLQPNYRGGSGRGAQFAALGRAQAQDSALGPLGRHRDVDDVVALTDAAIRQGLADPASLFVVGWGFGGYLAYLAALRNGLHGFGWQFQGAVCGAAITDWDTLAVTSSMGYQYANLSGRAPWKYDLDADIPPPKQKGEKAKYNRHQNECAARAAPSPLWEFVPPLRARRIPRLLVFHGEADTLVPVSQAEGMRRALDSAPWPGNVITYPSQSHFFQSRECIEDMLRRTVHFVVRPLDIHIGELIVGHE